jgi:hypothetical protein
MVVPSRPRRAGSPVISATGLIGDDGLVGPERIRVDRRGGARHPGELYPGHETAALPQRHRLLPNLATGRVLSSLSWRVHEPYTFTEAVSLRSQTGLTGSGRHRYSCGGFGEDTHTCT